MRVYLHGIYIIALSTGLLFLHSCVDEIELGVPQGQIDAVSISGRLLVADDITEIVVETSKVFVFDGSSTTLRVKNVDLINDKGKRLALDFIEEGTFYKQISQTDPFEIKSGLSYKISVELFDGRIYESIFETFNAVETSDLSVSVQQKENGIVDINLQTDINNNQSFPSQFRWTVTGTLRVKDNPEIFGIVNSLPTTCYISRALPMANQIFFNGFETIKGTIIFKGKVFSGNLNDWITGDTMYFNVLQESLSNGAYDFFNQIDLTNALDGSMFQPAPGKVKTNLINVNDPDEEVFGFFYATERKRFDVMFTPDQIGIEVNASCTTPPPMNFTPADCFAFTCCSCGSQPNSSVRKPVFWK